jgi:hypothetical protein
LKALELNLIANLASEMQSEVEDPSRSNMEIDGFEGKIVPDTSDKGEESKTSNVIFSRENPLISKEAADLIQPQSSYSLSESPEKKIYRYGRNQLGRSYHLAIISHNWDMADSLVAMADVQTLNHMLCMTLDFVWFLNTRRDLCRITGLIKGIVKGGASDFMRAMLRTAFLASCVSAYQSNLIGSGEGGNVLSQK